MKMAKYQISNGYAQNVRDLRILHKKSDRFGRTPKPALMEPLLMWMEKERGEGLDN